MTIVVAWVRKIRQVEELVFVSDSRLRGGYCWDECPKLTTLPGKTGVFAFAGDTSYAYPIMLQARQAMTDYTRIETRAMDISHINGRILRLVNGLVDSVYDLVASECKTDNEFIFGGYSWISKEFKIWRYYYNATLKMFEKDRQIMKTLPYVKNTYVIIGDQKEEFKKRLKTKLIDKYGSNYNIDEEIYLDMEPFEVICDMLRESSKADSIGGAPQMIKSYQYMNCRPIGIYWPKKTDTLSNRTLLGRQLSKDEGKEYWFMDPETCVTNPCYIDDIDN